MFFTILCYFSPKYFCLILQICSIVVLCLAINIRYDKVFGNSDIEDIFSRLNVTDHTFSRAINIFSIVTVTFSSVSIAVVIFSIVVMAVQKWKSVLNIVVNSLNFECFEIMFDRYFRFIEI